MNLSLPFYCYIFVCSDCCSSVSPLMLTLYVQSPKIVVPYILSRLLWLHSVGQTGWNMLTSSHPELESLNILTYKLLETLCVCLHVCMCTYKCTHFSFVTCIFLILGSYFWDINFKVWACVAKLRCEKFNSIIFQALFWSNSVFCF